MRVVAAFPEDAVGQRGSCEELCGCLSGGLAAIFSECAVLQADIRKGCEHQQRPITEEADGRRNDDAFARQKEMQRGCGQVAERDAVQHPGERDVRPWARDAAIVKHADAEEQRTAPQDAHERWPAPSLHLRRIHRKDDSHADKEEEEREDRIEKTETGPLHMLELRGDGRDDRAAACLLQGVRHLLAADDPEHVEPAQRIHRDQTRGSGRCGDR